jgi:hypothetical protein
LAAAAGIAAAKPSTGRFFDRVAFLERFHFLGGETIV